MADRETTREHRPHLMVADSPYLLLITAFSFALALRPGRCAVVCTGSGVVDERKSKYYY